MDRLITYALTLAAYAGFAVMLVVLAGAVVGIRDAVRRRRRRRLRRPCWSMTLLVDAEDDVVRPRVQIRGTPLPRRAVVRLELVDRLGATRLAFRAVLPPFRFGTDVAFPAFAPPEGSSAPEVLTWRWDVSVHQGRRVRARWRERLNRVGINAEGELAFGGDLTPVMAARLGHPGLPPGVIVL